VYAKDSHKTVIFVTKTGEAYNMTETIHLEFRSMAYFMHVQGQLMGGE
jgi:hypothetical protein